MSARRRSGHLGAALPLGLGPASAPLRRASVAPRAAVELSVLRASHVNSGERLAAFEAMLRSWKAQELPVPLYVSISAEPALKGPLEDLLRRVKQPSLHALVQPLRLSQFEHYREVASHAFTADVNQVQLGPLFRRRRYLAPSPVPLLSPPSLRQPQHPADLRPCARHDLKLQGGRPPARGHLR